MKEMDGERWGIWCRLEIEEIGEPEPEDIAHERDRVCELRGWQDDMPHTLVACDKMGNTHG